MAEGNGLSSDGMATPAASDEVAIFKVGGRELRVPALTLWDLERSKNDFLALGPELNFIDYARNVILIVAAKLAPDTLGADVAMAEQLMKSCTIGEMRELANSMNKLLEVSGFNIPPTQQDSPVPEAEASPGTGTSTESPVN